MVTRCSDIETSLNVCTTRLPITPKTPNKNKYHRFAVHSVKNEPAFAVQSVKIETGFAVQSVKIEPAFAVHSVKNEPVFAVQSVKIETGFAVQSVKIEPAFAVHSVKNEHPYRLSRCIQSRMNTRTGSRGAFSQE